MFYCLTNEVLRLYVKLTPRASKDEFKKVEKIADQEYLVIRVRAIPEKGEANKALLKLLGKELKIPVNSIKLLTGASSRLKQVAVAIVNDEIIDKLQDWQKKTR